MTLWLSVALAVRLIAVIAMITMPLQVPAMATPLPGDVADVLYRVEVLPDVRVRMRDGVELAVRITRPEAQGKFPALLAYNPYRALTTLKAAPSEREFSTGIHAPHYFAERGYISVNFDVRGTGASGGSSTGMYSDAERLDGYDMVEWIAAQPWSNGNVGMWGFSYGGVVAWQVAAMAPPHLKAIIVGSGTDDVYRDWAYPGGVPRPLVFGAFAALMAASNFAPPDADSTGGDWAQIWEEHLQNNVPWSIELLQRHSDPAYWRARSLRPDYSRIKCAVFVIGGWADWYPSAALRAFANLKVPKRALIGPWTHYWPEVAFPGPRIDARPEYLKWFGQFLKGVDTGVLNEPPLTLYVNHYQAPAPVYEAQPGSWRHENEWPLARTRDTPMYLGSQGQLDQQADVSGTPERDSYTYRASVGAMSGTLAMTPPLDQRPDEAYSLIYTTAPLESDLEITGTPTANLFVSSSADIAYFHVRLCDVAPDGTSRLISDGGLNATHRISHERPEPLQPHEVYPLKFDLKSVSHLFRAGHRMRVDISSADFLNAWPVSKAAVNSIVRGAQFPSHVLLPVVPAQSPLLPKPRLPPSPNPLTDPIANSEYTLTRDPVKQTTTVNMGNGPNRTRYTVSDLNPAQAVLNSDSEYVVSRQNSDIEVQAHTVTSSDSKAFHHLVEVEVTVDGKRHFNKSWTVSVPRALN